MFDVLEDCKVIQVKIANLQYLNRHQERGSANYRRFQKRNTQ
jgi:hypothetical protein